MATPNHFSSPLLSNWQSAVAKVATSAMGGDQPFLDAVARRPIDFANPLVAAAAHAAEAHEANVANRAPPPPQNEAERVARAAFNLAAAYLQGDHEAVAAAQAALARFGECDPRWAECIAEFVTHYAVTAHGDVPYRRWTRPEDFVSTMADKVTIGVIGDWGTGEARAQALLAQVAKHNVDILLHVGDIYYSCTTTEADTFCRNVWQVFPRNGHVRVLSLCGNHDMYSGAAPYYAVLDRIGQPASFFCLRNSSWQLIGADTGFDDFDPFHEGEVATAVQDYDADERGSYSELVWHQHKLRTAGGRRTLLATHHQPFSRNSPIAGKVVNERLLAQFGPPAGGVDLWLWGHEHNQVVYKEYRGVKRGRCIGASAIPVPQEEDVYRADPSIAGDAPDLVAGTELGKDARLGLYNLGFAVIDLDGPACRERYYEFETSTGTERLLHDASF